MKYIWFSKFWGVFRTDYCQCSMTIFTPTGPLKRRFLKLNRKTRKQNQDQIRRYTTYDWKKFPK